jgi:trk system potassium uptake protein TrkH
VSAILTVVGGAMLAVASTGSAPPRLDARQGFLLTTGAWAVFLAVAGLPLMLGAPHLSFTDAYFEMTSAMTTTGGTVIVGLDELPRGPLLWRGLVSWIGGMGVAAFNMASITSTTGFTSTDYGLCAPATRCTSRSPPSTAPCS